MIVGWQLTSSWQRCLLRLLGASRNPIARNAVERGMEILLTVLLVLMIPGLLTYLVPERARETARD